MITVEITADETFNKFKKHKFGYLGGRDFAVSDDGMDWEVINHYPDLSLTDPNTALIGAYYYIASDNGIWKTKDFNTFTKINAAISDSKHTDLHSFEWFQDLNGSWFIKYNATAPNGSVYSYWADFDETTDSFVDTVDQFNLPLGDTSGLAYVRGNYYIWMAGDKLYKAADFKDQFKEVATDISGSTAHQLFSSVVSDNYLYVYFIDGNKTYMRSSKTTNLIHWTKPVEVADVGLGSYFYNAKAVTVYPSYKRERTFDKVLKVTANGFKQTVPISCMVFSSLQVHWEQNGTWQIDFTAYDDSSISYAMLAEEAEIVFNGQTFIVKQAVEDAGGGIDTKQITASHVYNEINRVRQRKTKTGTLTYTVNDVLSFYLDDKTANPLGFTYHVYGNFDKQQIENLGNSSGSDMISKILDQWPKAIVYPDNKEIKVYTPEAFEKDYGGRIDYLNNSSDVKMTVDSTGITNQVKVFGKQVENTSDNATDDSKVKYYFEPFIVEDKASIRQYKLHPMDDISDERFTNKDAMQKYAQGQLSPNPAISIEITMEDNEMPIAGEKRHLIAKPLKLETDLAVIGYTWHPFDSSQKNSLSFANLPASILQTQASINSQIRKVQLIAQQAINSAKTGTRNYVSDTDPMQNNNIDVRAGDIWTLPLVKKTNGLMVRSFSVQAETNSDTNQTIYTNPDDMDKVDVQLSIWNGSRWLEISNQRTINTINDNQHKVADQVAEQQEGIAKAVQDAQTAVTNADKAIEQAGFANDTAKTAKEVADSLKEDVTGAKSDSATALQQAKDAMDNATDAKTTANSIKADVDTVKGELTSKADKTDVDNLSGTVKTQGTAITQNAKDIESKASQSDVNTLTGRVETAESNITQNANSIKSKVSSSDVQGILDNGGYATQKWTGSQIDQKADEISSTVTEVSNKVDNLEIGGRNLLLDTDFWITQPNTSQPLKWAINQDDLIGETITISFRVDIDNVTAIANQKRLVLGFSWVSHSDNTIYVDPSLWVNEIGVSIHQIVAKTIVIQKDAKLITLTPRIYNQGVEADSIKVGHPKIEKGTKATDWSPAPEDLATVTALSKVDQKADSISTTVTNNKTDADSKFTNINQTINGIQSTVANKADSSTVTQLSDVVDSKVSTDDYNSEITQLADDINLRVTKDGLISQINQQAGGNTLIQVSGGKGKLYFDSSSVVFSGKAFIPSAAITSIAADKIDVSTARIGSGSNYIDMTGGSIAVNKGNTSTTLNGDNIFIGRNDSDNRYRWGTKIDRFGLSFGVPAKQDGSDSKWNYETQGYLSGDGWNYDTASMTGNGESGIVLGITPRQEWGNDNGDDNHIEHAGGDYFQLGKYIPTNSSNDLDKRTFLPALIYLASPANTIAGGQGLHVMSNLIIHDTGTMSFYGNSNNGIYFDEYGSVNGSPGSSVYRVNDRNGGNTFAVELNGSNKVWFGKAYSDGGGSLYSADNDGWWMRNHDGSYGNVNAKAFIQKSSIDLKKNIEMADTDKLANDIYNMDVTTWNYKEETSQNAKHIGAVIGGDYHINSCLLSDDKAGVNTTSLTFALVATVQKQAKQISELMATVEALKIKNGD